MPYRPTEDQIQKRMRVLIGTSVVLALTGIALALSGHIVLQAIGGILLFLVLVILTSELQWISVMSPVEKPQRPTHNAQPLTPNAEHPTPNTQRPTPNA